MYAQIAITGLAPILLGGDGGNTNQTGCGGAHKDRHILNSTCVPAAISRQSSSTAVLLAASAVTGKSSGGSGIGEPAYGASRPPG